VPLQSVIVAPAVVLTYYPVQITHIACESSVMLSVVGVVAAAMGAMVH
jgi:hypothetical protein